MLQVYQGLTERQAAFVSSIARGYDIRSAAKAAGYSSWQSSGNSAMRSPAVATAIDYELRLILATEMAPAALHLLYRMVRGEGKWGERVRLDASKHILSIAGYVPPKQIEALQEKALEEMNLEELHAQAARLYQELGDRAKPAYSASLVDVPSELADLA